MIDDFIKTLEKAHTANRKLLKQIDLYAVEQYCDGNIEAFEYYECMYAEIENVWYTIDNEINKLKEET